MIQTLVYSTYVRLTDSWGRQHASIKIIKIYLLLKDNIELDIIELETCSFGDPL